MSPEQVRKDLLHCYQAALQAVHGRECVIRHLRQATPVIKSCALVAIGKASQAMSEGALEVLAGQIKKGLVICKAGQNQGELAAHTNIQVMESAHPVPDESSLVAGQALLKFIESLPEDMPVLFLISGGTSALVEVLPEGITLVDLQQINQAMLAGGMTIGEMNRVRKTISLIKGGGLCPYLGERPVINLLLSDVPDDDPAVIGSGLLVYPDEGPALPDNLPAVVQSYLANLPLSADVNLNQHNIKSTIVGSNKVARDTAAKVARELDYPVTVFDSLLTEDVATVADIVIDKLKSEETGIYIWGAEPTVCLPDSPGRGGRNQQLALLLATRIENNSRLYFLVAATDGNDGVTEDAGGLVDGQSIQRGELENMDAEDCLQRADAGAFLEASGDLISTGFTGTNVMDLIIACKT